MKFVAVLSLLVVATVTSVWSQQPSAADPTCSKLKLEIAVPDDVIRPESTVLLEIKLTNVSGTEVSLSTTSPDYWSSELQFEVRDSRGLVVPKTDEWTRALAARQDLFVRNLFVSRTLAPGSSVNRLVMLEKLFDLGSPGQYTVRAIFNSNACGSSGATNASNLLHIKVDRSTKRSSKSRQVSVTLNAMRQRLPVGWAAPLDVVIQNRSDRPLRWALDSPPNLAPDEFLTGVEVSDEKGELRGAPRQPNLNWDSTRFRASVSTVEIPPHQSAEWMFLVGGLFDVSSSGKYLAKVELFDPLSHRRIGSNLVSFSIEDTGSLNSAPLQPPFLVTLRTGNWAPHKVSDVQLCMSNLSDHDIRMDNSSGKDFEQVEDSEGHPAPLTEAAQEARKLIDRTRLQAGVEECCTWWKVEPRKALCGGLTLSAIYDLSPSRAYRVRIDRYDEPDARPGQKLSELPVVHSNWLAITDNSPATPAK